MKYIIYILFFLISVQGVTQTFADAAYYLVDSLDLETVSSIDKELLNRNLIKFHKANSGYNKILSLDEICEEMSHNDWGKYQIIQHNLIEKELLNFEKGPEKIKLLKMLAKAKNNLGMIHNVKGDISKTLSYFKSSLEIRKQIGDKKGIASSLNNIGFIHNDNGNVSMALSYYHKSLKIREEIGDKKGQSTCFNNIGTVYDNQGELEQGLQYYRKCLELSEEIGDNKGKAESFNNIGFIYIKQGKKKEGLEYHFKSLKLKEEMGYQRGIAYSLNNIGGVYLEEGELNEAMTYFKKSLAIRESINDIEEIATVLINIGKIHLKKGDTKLAINYAKRSMELSNVIGFPKVIRSSAELMSDVYESQGNGLKALQMYKLHIQMKDSLNNEEIQKAAVKQQAKYEYEKQKTIDDTEHDKLLAIEKEAKEKQKILTIATAGGLGLVVVFLLFVFNRLRVTKKQKLVIEKQKQEVEKQKEVVDEAHYELEEKNQEIMDSIVYAKRIQSAILPPAKLVKEYLKKSFILYKPKDVVAGDFYWMEHKDNKVLFAAADCTGHGVPGAMVSVVCNNALNRSVREDGLTDPGKILNKTRDIVVQEFEKSEEEVKDGMDIALCSLEGNKLHYAGAHNPLWIIRNGKIIETKANKQPIGKFENPEPYTTHSFYLEQGDSIYIFSDGYVDQFGGEKGKKFKAKAFRALLLSIQDKSMEEQKQIIDNSFETWKGALEQIDDVCVIGVGI
jgi:serine phosphatase RsbU (regulator of sigma subunit)